jgi:hypothetical protein
MTSLRAHTLAFSTLLLLAGSACSDDGALDEVGEGTESEDADGETSSDETSSDETSSDETSSGETSGDEGAGGDDGGGGDGGGETGTTGEPIEPGQLTAGEWRDLDHWDFWRGLFVPGSEWLDFDTYWGFHTKVRVPVVVTSSDVPVIDVPVELRDAQGTLLWHARTDNLGRAELWPSLAGGEVELPLTIAAGGVELPVDMLPGEGILDPHVLELDAAPSDPTNLDLMFVIDTTGSMGDELGYLQAELGDVISRVDTELGGELDLRVSVNFYRDEGDAYVVDSNPFTTQVVEALDQLAAQSADGGGDYPEALTEALVDGVQQHEWSASARARLLFLVLDAPPHDTADNRASMANAIAAAAEQGVRIIPVAASGVDKPTEFLLRDFDIATGGTYTFLTSDSGIGGEHLEPTVGEYTVELLNDLLVRLIVESME